MADTTPLLRSSHPSATAGEYPLRRHVGAVVRKTFVYQILVNSALKGKRKGIEIDPPPYPAYIWVPQYGLVPPASGDTPESAGFLFTPNAQSVIDNIEPSLRQLPEAGEKYLFPIWGQQMYEFNGDWGSMEYNYKWMSKYNFFRGPMQRGQCSSSPLALPDYPDPNTSVPIVNDYWFIDPARNFTWHWMLTDHADFCYGGNCYFYCIDYHFRQQEIIRAWDQRDGKAPQYTAGFAFQEANTATHQYDVAILYNETYTRGLDVPTLINTVATGILKTELNATWNVMLSSVADLPTLGIAETLDVASLLGAFFYMMALQLQFPIYVGHIVYEKEHRMREIMRMMGMQTRVYWIAAYLFDLILYTIIALVLIVSGHAFGFDFFTKNSPVGYLMLFFVWGNAMIAQSFLASSIFTRSRTAAVTSYLWVFGTTIISQTLVSSYVDNNPDSPTLAGMSIVPPLALYRGLRELSDQAAFESGLSSAAFPGSVTAQACGFLAGEWIVMLLAAVYIDLVFPTVGVPLHPLFFLGFKVADDEDTSSARNRELSGVAVSEYGADRLDDDVMSSFGRDVREERDFVDSGAPDSAVVARALRKVYRSRQGKVVAVKDLFLAIRRNECFGLLGHNGAGKTTLINMLCGFFSPTSGHIEVSGVSVTSDADRVHRSLGICPQHDILWGVLTCREHLDFYARLKGVASPKNIPDAVRHALDDVGLLYAADVAAAECSGGMRRRLSVAIALLGSPEVIVMDEPSTGLDPASRRQLWEVIGRARKQSSILLTTHSMEEADALCDRIGIFAEGELMCLGSPKQLKARFGQFFRLVIICDYGAVEQAMTFIGRLVPEAAETDQISNVVKYNVPKESIVLSNFFSAMEESSVENGIIDWGISNTTLEDAFLHVTTSRSVYAVAAS